MTRKMDNVYCFWVELKTGEYLRWKGLSSGSAIRMNSITKGNLPDGVVKCGWGKPIGVAVSTSYLNGEMPK